MTKSCDNLSIPYTFLSLVVFSWQNILSLRKREAYGIAGTHPAAVNFTRPLHTLASILFFNTTHLHTQSEGNVGGETATNAGS